MQYAWPVWPCQLELVTLHRTVGTEFGNPDSSLIMPDFDLSGELSLKIELHMLRPKTEKVHSGNGPVSLVGHRLHCGLRIAGHRLRAADHTQVAGCGLQIAGCRPHSDCGLRATDCGLLTAVLRAAGHRLRAAGHMLWIAKIAGC